MYYMYSLKIWTTRIEPKDQWSNLNRNINGMHRNFLLGKRKSAVWGQSSICREMTSGNLAQRINNLWHIFSFCRREVVGLSPIYPRYLSGLSRKVTLGISVSASENFLESLKRKVPHIIGYKLGHPTHIIISEPQELSLPLTSLLFWVVWQNQHFDNDPFTSNKIKRKEFIAKILSNSRKYFNHDTSYSEIIYTLFAYQEISKAFNRRNVTLENYSNISLFQYEEFRDPYTIRTSSGVASSTRRVISMSQSLQSTFSKFIDSYPQINPSRIESPLGTRASNWSTFWKNERKGSSW